MATPADIDARRYYRVAYQRLEDGSLMLEELDRPRGAVYLTGYAVECILKALVLARTPAKLRHGMAKSFRGAIAHDLFWLRDRLVERHVAVPANVAEGLVYVSSWSVDLRYEPGSGDREEARTFISSTRAIMEWASRSM